MISDLVPRSRYPNSQQLQALALTLVISLSWPFQLSNHLYFVRDLWPRDYFGDQEWVSLDICLSDFQLWWIMRIIREI